MEVVSSEGGLYDAALTTAALQWLDADRPVSVYRDLDELTREEGVFLDGNHLFFGPDKPMLRSIAEGLRKKRQEESHAVRGIEDRATRWEEVSREPGVDALLDAGFREAEVVRQDLDNRLLAVAR